MFINIRGMIQIKSNIDAFVENIEKIGFICY